MSAERELYLRRLAFSRRENKDPGEPCASPGRISCLRSRHGIIAASSPIIGGPI